MNESELMMEIVKRAKRLGIIMNDNLSFFMDLTAVNNEFGLRLEELLKANDFNFSHDVVGIQRNINRVNRKLENHFIPRYANIN